MDAPPIERDAGDRDCHYYFDEVLAKTEAQRIAEGFDKDRIKSLHGYGPRNGKLTRRANHLQKSIIAIF